MSTLNAEMKNYNIIPASKTTAKVGNIEILDSKIIDFPSYNGIAFREISALAYKDKVLYALGDRGVLYKLKLKLESNKIKNLRLLKAHRLQDSDRKDLKKLYRDSEGLAFKGDKLLISYEKSPRIELRSKNGKHPQNVKINKKLNNIKSYIALNKGLESVAYSKKYGVVTAPEEPLNGKKNKHIIYGKNRTWKFKKDGSITSLEFISKEKLLILQREFHLFFLRRKIVISTLNLSTGKYKVLAKLESKDGWKLDNFEGLTKVGKNRYLMISDDNDSVFQKTLLVLFKIDDKEGKK
jgi:hypothetical protein